MTLKMKKLKTINKTDTTEVEEVPWKKEPFEFKGKTYEVGFQSPSIKIKGESGTFKIISWEISPSTGKLIVNCWWEGFYYRSFYAERIKANRVNKRTKAGGHVKYCDDHPQYGAIRRPRTDCKPCWSAYNAMHPAEETKPSPVKKKTTKKKK
jgi:hypothetical protein